MDKRIEAFEFIKQALAKAVTHIDLEEVTETTDLLKENILDSLDSMVFIMELSELVDVDFPEEGLVEKGYYNISTLLDIISKE